MVLLLPALLPDRPRPARARGSLLRTPRSSSFLLPVEVEQAWSDQIKDVEANGMPDMTGVDSKPYIFMGAREDGKGHAKLLLDSALPQDVRDKILWRFAKKGTTNPEPGSSAYDEQGKIIRMTLDSPPVEEEKDFVVVFGYDKDGDGELSQSEIVGTPTTMHDPSSDGIYNPVELPFVFKIVGQTRYNEALDALTDLWQSPLVQNQAPNAASLLQAFCEKTIPSNSTSELAVIERNEPGLSHPVGIAFTPAANPGQSINAVYGKEHDLTLKFIESTPFWNWLNGKLVEKTEEVRNFFHDLPLSVTEHTFLWDFGEGSVNFRGSTDFDCWLALGSANVKSISVEAKVHRHFLTLASLKVSGFATDIYDFDYDASGITIPGLLGFGGLSVQPSLGAELQSGFPTLGEGGRVYKQRLEMQDSPVPLNPNHPFRFEPPL